MSKGQTLFHNLLRVTQIKGDGPLCEAFDLLADRTGQNKYRYAANMLRGSAAGRPIIDDRAEIEAIMGLIGKGCSPARAIASIARITFAKSDRISIASLSRRYRRRLKEFRTK